MDFFRAGGWLIYARPATGKTYRRTFRLRTYGGPARRPRATVIIFERLSYLRRRISVNRYDFFSRLPLEEIYGKLFKNSKKTGNNFLSPYCPLVANPNRPSLSKVTTKRCERLLLSALIVNEIYVSILLLNIEINIVFIDPPHEHVSWINQKLYKYYFTVFNSVVIHRARINFPSVYSESFIKTD